MPSLAGLDFPTNDYLALPCGAFTYCRRAAEAWVVLALAHFGERGNNAVRERSITACRINIVSCNSLQHQLPIMENLSDQLPKDDLRRRIGHADAAAHGLSAASFDCRYQS